MDLEDAEKRHGVNLQSMNELEHEILQLQQKSDVLDSKLKKMTEIISSLRLMEAQHETLVAENTRRFEALPSEVEGPLEQLEEFQVRWSLVPAASAMLTRSACASPPASIRRNCQEQSPGHARRREEPQRPEHSPRAAQGGPCRCSYDTGMQPHVLRV